MSLTWTQQKLGGRNCSKYGFVFSFFSFFAFIYDTGVFSHPCAKKNRTEIIRNLLSHMTLGHGTCRTCGYKYLTWDTLNTEIGCGGQVLYIYIYIYIYNYRY
jgi:hypothetical protein